MNLESVASQSSGVQSPPAGSPTAPADRPGAQTPKASKIQKRFAVFATPQTDSSHLRKALDQHPQVRCLGELFNPKGTVLKSLGWKTRKAMSEAAQSPVEFLERLVEQLEEEETCKPYLGFEMMLHHDPRMIDHLIADPNWTVVVLERRDLLAQWLDMAVAKKNGRWEVGGIQGKRMNKGGDDGDDDLDDDDFDDDATEATDGAEGAAPVVRKVKFDAWRFEQFCFRMQARYASTYHRLEKRKYFKLYSEEIDASLPELLEFLGVDPGPAREPQEPRKIPSLKERIENYEDYARYAKKNPR
jgi:hypothetical protein